ncbi:LamG domain-containing protein [Candidatus Poribacteria bacterium]|nr:LamG domain-containing protein [Candidatus Poribacteria bacterium]
MKRGKNVFSCIILIIAGCFLLLGICREGISEKDLAGHWLLDDGAGEAVKDASGNGNDGKIEGKGNWVTGVLGGALELRSKEKGKVKILSSATLNATKGVTMCAWVKLSSIYDGGDWKLTSTVIGKAHVYYLTINEKGNLQSYLYGPQPQEWVVGKANLNKYIGDWVHVAAVYDGSSHIVYVDGNQDASVAKKGDIVVTNDDVYLGWVDYDRYIDGAIDEAMVWTRGLSEKEIKGLAAAKAVLPKDKLAVSWGKLKA